MIVRMSNLGSDLRLKDHIAIPFAWMNRSHMQPNLSPDQEVWNESLRKIKYYMENALEASARSDLASLQQILPGLQGVAINLGDVLIQVQVQLLEQAVIHKQYGRISNILSRIETSIQKLETVSRTQLLEQEDTRTKQIKYIGTYLVEAELLTPVQVQVALADQQATGMRFGDVLVSRGWVKRGTIEYLMDKIVNPERAEMQKQTTPAADESAFLPPEVPYQEPEVRPSHPISDKETLIF